MEKRRVYRRQLSVCPSVYKRKNSPLLKKFWLFGHYNLTFAKHHNQIYAFYAHGSVHRESMSITVQQDATIYSLLYLCKLLYMFRVVTPPIIRSTYNCNYSIWHWSNFGKMQCGKSAKDERYGPYRLCYLPRSRKIPETVRSIPLIFSWLHTLHFPKFDQCQML